MSNQPTPPPANELKDYVLRVPKTPWTRFRSWLTTPLGIVAIVLAVVVLILAVQARPLYRAAKAMRVKRIVAEAGKAREQGDTTTETRLLREAISLLPAHELTWRARAQFEERRGDPGALVSYLRLLDSEGATADDAEQACRLASMRGSAKTCSEFLALALKVPGASERPAVMGLQARVLAAERKFAAATALAEKAAALAPHEHPLRLLQANLLMQSADHVEPSERTAVAKRSVAILDELSKASDQTAAQALEILLQMLRKPAAAAVVGGFNANAWATAAERHPEAGPRLRTLAWNYQLAARKADASAFLDEFVVRWQTAPANVQLEAARWLNQNGYPWQALRFTEAQKESSEDWFVLHIDVLAATKQWSAVIELLEKTEGQAAQLPAALRTLFRLRSRAEMGERVDPDEDWREIMLQIQEAPIRVQVFVAQYAEKTGETKKAATIYRRTLQSYSASASTLSSNLDRETKLACYTGFLRCTPGSTPALEVLPVTEALVAEFREFEGARDDVLYLRLLVDIRDEQTRAEILKLNERSIRTLPSCTIVALFELRNGNPTAAERAYEGLTQDWKRAPDALKAVRAAVLTAVGKDEESQALRATIQEHKLRPEELALLHPAPVPPPSEEPTPEAAATREPTAEGR